MTVILNTSLISKYKYTVSSAHYIEENKKWLDWKHS